jgi:indolepyruvate ferredoxin oxidoreductase beta subunit
MYVKEGTIVVVNSYRIPPPTVNMGQAVYPTEQEVESILSSAGGKIKWIAATQIAADLGNPAMVGVVLLGAASGLLGGDESVWLKVIESMVPEKFQDMNKQAFLQGRAANIT